MQRIHNADELRACRPSSPADASCRCGLGSCPGWTSLTEERWPAAQMQAVATLRDPELHEPTFEERHPERHALRLRRQRRWRSRFFPYNRCELWRCGQCHRQLLRYTEFGGYYVDHRVRELAPNLEILD